MSFAFPLISTHVLKTLHCVPDVDLLNDEQQTEGENHDVVMILADKSIRTVCWHGTHLSIGILAILVLLIYILFYEGILLQVVVI